MTTSPQHAFDRDEDCEFEYWRNPRGFNVAFDELKFLYIPDQVVSRMVAELAQKVFAWQKEHHASGDQITQAVMVTMGGMLPGVLLHDHLAWHPDPDIPAVEFGTLGVKYYAGPAQPLDKPIVVQDVTLNVRNKVVGVVEDLGRPGRHGPFCGGIPCRSRGPRLRADCALAQNARGILGHAGHLLRLRAGGYLDHHAARARGNAHQAGAALARARRQQGRLRG